MRSPATRSRIPASYSAQTMRNLSAGVMRRKASIWTGWIGSSIAAKMLHRRGAVPAGLTRTGGARKVARPVRKGGKEPQ